MVSSNRASVCKEATVRLKAFTLMELLVVISIIALLMAIMMPALSKVQEQAKSLKCRSRLRQWGLYWDMYTQEYDGKFAAGCVSNWTQSEEIADDGKWWVVLKPYYGHNNVLRYCPKATVHWSEMRGGMGWGDKFQAWGVFGDQGTVEWGTEGIIGLGYTGEPIPGRWTAGVGGSYANNAWINDQPFGIVHAQQGTLSADESHSAYWRTNLVAKTNRIPLMTSNVWMGTNPHHTDDPPEYDGGQGYGMGGLCLDRHGDKLNMVFMDGSVKEVSFKELWTFKWNRLFSLGKDNYWGNANDRDWAMWGDGWMAHIVD